MRPARAIAATALATLALLPPAGAQAAPPVLVERVTFDRVFPNIPECPDFTTTGRFTLDITTRRYLGRDGEVTREVIHVAYVGTTTNDRTGTSLPMPGRRIITVDYAAGTQTEVGVMRRVTAPGEGIVLHESGRLVTDLERVEALFVAGPHELWEGSMDEYCAALA